jgi:hypothetical protein
MRLPDVLFHSSHQIFAVDSADTDDFTQWNLEPVDKPTLSSAHGPAGDDNGFFIVKAVEVQADGNTQKAYLDVVLPERAIDYAYSLENGVIVRAPLSPSREIIPLVAIEEAGNYEQFYSRSQPEVGLQVLRDGLLNAKSKWPIALDMAYILREENRHREAIEAFSLSLANNCPIPAVYVERARLYSLVGDNDAAEADWAHFEAVASPIARRFFSRR